ncbi:MAG TPA: glycosyltransferase family 39 protein [Xanthobacteraceae bacterium]|jgi:hypothetical protein
MRAPTGPGPLEATVLTEALRARPSAFVVLALAVHAALWTFARFIADPTPPSEVLVGLALGREARLGYVEGPPLAFWLLDLAYVFGGSFLVANLLPALSVALAGWLVFAFARKILGERHAAIATLLMVGVHPVAFPVGPLDADILQMPLVAASVLVWWNALHEGSRRARYGLAVLVVLLAYSGVQGLLVVFTLGLLTLADPRARAALKGLLLITQDWRAAIAGRDALIAVIVVLLVVAPRLIWLVGNGFAGFVPGLESGIEPGALTSAQDVMLQTLVGHMGLLVLIIVASTAFASDLDTAPTFVRPPVERIARRSAIVIATVPPLLALALGLIAGARQPITAAAPLFLYSGVFVMMFAPDFARVHRQRAVAIAALALLVLPPMLDAASSMVAPWVAERGRSTNWPAQAAGRYFTDVFRNRTSRRLEYVIGDARIASAVAYGSRDRPHVFIDGDPKRAPWIDQERLKKNGAIVVWTVAGLDPRPPQLLASRLPALSPEAPLPLNWVRSGRLNPVRLGWALIPPQN